jgi:hypothetical protein
MIRGNGVKRETIVGVACEASNVMNIASLELEGTMHDASVRGNDA